MTSMTVLALVGIALIVAAIVACLWLLNRSIADPLDYAAGYDDGLMRHRPRPTNIGDPARASAYFDGYRQGERRRATIDNRSTKQA